MYLKHNMIPKKKKKDGVFKMKKQIVIDKLLKEELKTFLRFLHFTYWTDNMTHFMSRKLYEELVGRKKK